MTTKYWAMERDALAKFRDFMEKNPISGLSAEIRDFDKKLESMNASDFRIIDKVAIISISGHLANRPTFWGFLLDGNIATYPLIIEKLGLAEANSEVTQIRLLVDTPGGELDGLFDLLDALKAVSKPLEAIVGARADSAGYGIVSQVDKIIAAGEISEMGSVGVGTTFFVDEDFVDITSSDAPNKWPDVTTEAGVNVIRSELDEIHAKFVHYISEGRSAATGRNITPDIVNSDFGRGGTMLAEAGLAAGMLDEIQPSPARISNADFFENSDSSSSGTAAKTIKKITKMDKITLQREHPETYAEIMQLGAAQEKERVEALLETGSECGKLDKAIEFVKNGACITQPKTQAAFLSARINNKDVENRAGDDPPPVTPPDPKDKKEDEETLTARYLDDRKKRGLNRA